MTDENSHMIPYPYEEFSSFWEDIFHDVNFDGIIFICGKTKKKSFSLFADYQDTNSATI